MSVKLLFAIVSITLALIFYSIGVWSEKIQKRISLFHIVCFWLGFLFDSLGTTIMSSMATVENSNSFHFITGMLAIGLMFIHAVWATVLIVKKDDNKMRDFNKFSIIVWVIWLVPYISGVVAGMGR